MPTNIEPSKERFFKILNVKTFEWRDSGISGGIGGNFKKSRKGKTWKRLSDVKSHLRNCINHLKNLRMQAIQHSTLMDVYNKVEEKSESIKDQVLIEYRLVEVERTPLKDIIDKM